MNKDALGDRMKGYESSSRFMRFLPIIARIDGKCFSKFTKGLDRPYDEGLIVLMRSVTAHLVKETNACIGYTQSDEITLVIYSEDPYAELLFGGKIQKMTSILASTATAKFNSLRPKYLPGFKEDIPALFDCRCFHVPNKEEAANNLLWREIDASRNSVLMLASHYLGHKKMMNKSCAELQEILWQEHKINYNDYPDYFKRGSFFRRSLVLLEPGHTDLQDIPEQYRPTKPIERHVIKHLKMPIFRKVTNRVGVIFNGEEPQTQSE